MSAIWFNGKDVRAQGRHQHIQGKAQWLSIMTKCLFSSLHYVNSEQSGTSEVWVDTKTLPVTEVKTHQPQRNKCFCQFADEGHKCELCLDQWKAPSERFVQS